jgi:VWFA-related protein
MMQSGKLQYNPTLVVALAILILMIAPIPSSARGSDDQSWPLYVNVEQDGKLVTGLTASNFRVFIDDRGQKFEVQAPETPSTVVLLMEYSRQSALFLKDIRNALQGFLDHAPEDNWYALVTFDRETNIVVDFTKDKSQIRAALTRLPEPMWSEINSYDAIKNILERTARLSGRRVIIFVGSGLDTLSRVSLDDVEKQLDAVDVSIYSLGAGSALRTSYEPYLDISTKMDLMSARAFLTMLSEKTGGDAWFPNFEIEFHDAMEGVMQDLGTQYKLVVKGAIPDDGRRHKIKVEAFTITNDKRNNFKVRVREAFRQPLT